MGCLAAVVIVLLCTGVRAELGDDNKEKIDKLAKLLQDTVREDLMKLFTQQNKTLDQAIDAVMKTLDYVDKNIDELKTHIEKTIEDKDNNTMENLKALEENTATMMTIMNETMMQNLESLNNRSMEEHEDLISWSHQRSHMHEDIMKTKLTVCAYDYGHFGEGSVTYNSTDGGYIKQSGSIQIFNNTNIKEEEVLSRENGIFKVPENASGEYIFTFTVTIDSFDQKTMPSCYFFVLNGEVIEGTEIFANVGTSRTQDRVPGSKQIFLKLSENDKVSVTQTCKTDIHDFHISFCAALLHLDKGSESPGGLFDDESSFQFPSGTPAVTDTWEYKFGGFNASETEEYDPKEKDNKPEITDIFEEAKIKDGDWKTENADWSV